MTTVGMMRVPMPMKTTTTATSTAAPPKSDQNNATMAASDTGPPARWWKQHRRRDAARRLRTGGPAGRQAAGRHGLRHGPRRPAPFRRQTKANSLAPEMRDTVRLCPRLGPAWRPCVAAACRVRCVKAAIPSNRAKFRHDRGHNGELAEAALAAAGTARVARRARRQWRQWRQWQQPAVTGSKVTGPGPRMNE